MPKIDSAVTSLLLSALVSLLVAWVTSRRAIVIEAEKARYSAQQKTLELLVARRLETYPAFYALLSDIPKAFDAVPTVELDLRSTLQRVNQWDSEHSLLMSHETSNCCHEFRLALVAAVGGGRRPSSEDRFLDLREKAMRLELALRTDLGLHGIGLAGDGRDLSSRSRAAY